MNHTPTSFSVVGSICPYMTWAGTKSSPEGETTRTKWLQKKWLRKRVRRIEPMYIRLQGLPPHPQGRTVKLSHDWRFLSRQPKQEQLQLAEAFVNPVPSDINLGVAPPLRQGLCTFCICQKGSCIKPQRWFGHFWTQKRWYLHNFLPVTAPKPL